MVDLIYATSNPAKVRSLRRRLEQSGFNVIQENMRLPEPRLDRVEDIAVFKAMFALQEFGGRVVANDAAFYIAELRGFPGTNVKFGLETIQIEGMIRLASRSSCWFRHALSYHDQSTTAPTVFADSVDGTIADAIRGKRQSWHWSDLCLIFIPTGSEKTMGQMDEEEWIRLRDSGQFGDHYANQFLAWYRLNRS